MKGRKMPVDTNPPMRDCYSNYYKATHSSKVYGVFCDRVIGGNFAQHGFSDMAQLDRLLAFLNLRPGDRVLDLGCGNGTMAEYISLSSYRRKDAPVRGFLLVPHFFCP